jgi:hypothetical protein
MINKSFRLSNGFWHKFLPNSNRLFSPQNIPIEIWDVEKQCKEGKFNPGIYGIKSITFSNNGNYFVFHGGTDYAKSEFKIYETNTLNCIDEFKIMEECSNSKFINEDKSLIFSTWDGNIYKYDIQEKLLEKQFSMETHMFTLINNGNFYEIIYIVTSEKTNKNNNVVPFILEYNINEKIGKKVDFTEERNPYEINGKTNARISGLALSNNNLAILTTHYSESGLREAKSYIYDIKNKKVTLIKDKFKTKDVFYNYGCIAWNNDGNKLAFIGINEVYIVNIENNDEETIVFEKATSVEFSNCGKGLAVGGQKAKIF